MSHDDDDDKPTVVLDLNALKKQKEQQEKELANMVSELEFNVGSEAPKPKAKPQAPAPVAGGDDIDSLLAQAHGTAPVKEQKEKFTVILFDFQSDFFEKSKDKFPKGHEYRVARSLNDLNEILKSKKFQIVVFNYDVNPKAVNQLSAQIKQKFPTTKTLIMAKAISPEKAKLHAQTPSGASGYCQFPVDATKIEKEFFKIHSESKKAA